jgi:hypothetical protein
MNPSRRTFLKTSLAVSAGAALSQTLGAAGASNSAPRECYDLRAYRLKPGASPALIETYLEKALIPALAKRGVTQVGVFTELEVDKKTEKGVAKPDTPLWVLIPYPTLEAFASVSADINTDPAVVEAGAAYLNVAKANPAFDRIDSWLYLAFRGMPRMELPAFSKSKTPTRVFEMRDYESHSEVKALSKMAMFDDGEIPLMKDLGMNPVFFGQGIAGPNLPHLRYFTSGSDLSSHLGAWKKFGPDPRWIKMKDDPKYANNTSKNTARFLAPRPYSAI